MWVLSLQGREPYEIHVFHLDKSRDFYYSVNRDKALSFLLRMGSLRSRPEAGLRWEGLERRAGKEKPVGVDQRVQRKELGGSKGKLPVLRTPHSPLRGPHGKKRRDRGWAAAAGGRSPPPPTLEGWQLLLSFASVSEKAHRLWSQKDLSSTLNPLLSTILTLGSHYTLLNFCLSSIK